MHIFAYLYKPSYIIKAHKEETRCKNDEKREELAKFGLDATAFLGAITSGEEVPNSWTFHTVSPENGPEKSKSKKDVACSRPKVGKSKKKSNAQ